MRWMPVGVVVVLGAALLVLGSLQPLVRLSSTLVRPPAVAVYQRLSQSFETSVVDLAFPPKVTVDMQVHDTYFIALERSPSWPAALVLAAAATAIGFAAARRRAAIVACVLLMAAIAWLFIVAGAPPPPPPPPEWTAYPPLSAVSVPTPLENCWPTWGALVLGTALLAASTFLRTRPAPDAAPQPPPLP